MKSPPFKEREFADLIKEHSRIINKVCYFYSSERLPFEDLRQEVYVNLWLSIDQFRGESKLSTWVYRVAVNTALMSMRGSRKRVETTPLDFVLAEIPGEIDEEQKEKLQMLHSLISRLEDIEKAIILLWLDEYSYDEIADAIGLKRNTVATRLHRIKEKLSKSV